MRSPRPADGTPSRRSVVVGGLGVALASGIALTGCTADRSNPAAGSTSTEAPNRSTGMSATSGTTGLAGTHTSAATGARSASTAPAGTAGTAGSADPGAQAAGPLGRPGPDIVAGSRASNSVALTFHAAGDPSLAASVIDLVERAGIRISVFCVGTWIGPNADLVRRLRDGGHDLGNHTWSHQSMPGLTAAVDDSEIGRAADALGSILGAPGPLFRPSGTRFSTPTIRAAAARHGYARAISYDTDSLDYTDPGPDAVVRATTPGLRSGAIVSLHFGHSATVAALPRILTTMADRGLTGRTLTDLFALPGALTTT